MISKTFEIRDEATFIPILAVKLSPGCEKDRFLLARAGFGTDAVSQSTYVLLCQINGGTSGQCSCDQFDWPGRTYHAAHEFILQHFDELESGAVVDVEFILGETEFPKVSEAA